MKRKFKYIITAIVIVFALAIGGFIVYVQDYYHSGAVAQEILADGNLVTYSNGDIYLEAASSTSVTTNDLIVFYPGGKVEYDAYLPLARMLQDQGVSVILCKMPFNLAVFDTNHARRYLDQFGANTRIYMMGHSLGGAMASSFASDNQDRVAGLILLGSYLYGSFPVENQLTIYGSNDLVLDRSKIDYDQNIVVIDGGNHSGFGDYGPQKGDGEATITKEMQQQVSVEAIIDFIGK